jgi:hypothetical protein
MFSKLFHKDVNYISFKQIICRVQYGTDLQVVETFAGREVFNKVWSFNDNVDRSFSKDILDTEVIEFSSKDGKLYIGIAR